MNILHNTFFCITLAFLLGLGQSGFGLENHPDAIINNTSDTTNVSNKNNDLKFLKKLFYERRKKHSGATKNIKNVESYERRYKMISIIIDEMVHIIESKKSIVERINDELKKNISKSLSDGNVKDALLSVCENTVLFGDIAHENHDITQRILKKKLSWNETLKWSLTFVNENPLLLDKSTSAMLQLVFQELYLTKNNSNNSNQKQSTNQKLSSQNINNNEKQRKNKKIKRKHGPQIAHIDL